MIDFPLGKLLEEMRCTKWHTAHFHLNGLGCPRCQSERRRAFRQVVHFS